MRAVKPLAREIRGCPWAGSFLSHMLPDRLSRRPRSESEPKRREPTEGVMRACRQLSKRRTSLSEGRLDRARLLMVVQIQNRPRQKTVRCVKNSHEVAINLPGNPLEPRHQPITMRSGSEHLPPTPDSTPDSRPSPRGAASTAPLTGVSFDISSPASGTPSLTISVAAGFSTTSSASRASALVLCDHARLHSSELRLGFRITKAYLRLLAVTDPMGRPRCSSSSHSGHTKQQRPSDWLRPSDAFLLRNGEDPFAWPPTA